MKILVAGISVRAMTESAVRGGYPVAALDAFGDQDLKRLADTSSLRRDFHSVYSPAALYRASRELSFDAIAYTANLENYPDILARFGSRHRILGNPPQAVASVRNWAGVFEKLRQAGFPVPKTIFKGKPSPADPKHRWLVKPLRSGGGHGIYFYYPEDRPRFEGKNAHGVPGFMLQEYIYGRPGSAAFVANGKECVVLGITEQLIGLKILGCRDFRYCGNLLPVHGAEVPDSTETLLDEIRRLSQFLTREYRLVGVNGIDFILRNGQVYLTEVNPRYSASMEIIELAYGVPIFRVHLDSVLDGRLPEFDLEAEMARGRVYGKSYLFAESDVNAPDTEGWHGKGIRDIPETGEKIRKGNPVCTILTSRSTREETAREMFRRAEELKKDLYG
jgi:predicted ATP-grasp superfamily ATP-dependent carboligase